jgi:hypothetical protein
MNKSIHLSFYFLCLIWTSSAFALRNFDGEYTQAQNRVLEGCSSAKSAAICKLAPLHKAVLAGNLQKITDLHSQGANLDAKAKSGWTASHFAAAFHEHEDVLKLLVSLGANQTILELKRGTPGQLWQMTHLSDSHLINVWNEDKQAVQQISADEFLALTRSRFIEATKISPLTLAKEWLASFPPRAPDYESSKVTAAMPFFKKLTALYQDTRLVQDQVYLKRVNDNVGFGLYALKGFEAGQIIGEYQGEFTGKLDRSDADYATQTIQGRHLRGYVAMAADGLPNSMMFSPLNSRGWSEPGVLVALRQIEADEPLLWSYAGHDIVWEVYQEQNQDELNGYIGQYGFKMPRGLATIDEQRNMQVVGYVMMTPLVFMRLFFDGRIGVKDIGHVRMMRSFLKPVFQTFHEQFDQFVTKLPRSKEKLAVLKTFMLSKIAEGNVAILYQFIASFNADMPLTAGSLSAKWNDEWEFFCAEWPHSEHYTETSNRGNCDALKRRDEL